MLFCCLDIPVGDSTKSRHDIVNSSDSKDYNTSKSTDDKEYENWRDHFDDPNEDMRRINHEVIEKDIMDVKIVSIDTKRHAIVFVDQIHFKNLVSGTEAGIRSIRY